MPVVFDEVVGTVEPDSAPVLAETPPGEPKPQPDYREIQRQLIRFKRREARLWAD